MALPETENMVTVRRLSAIASGAWEKAKGLFATKVANPANGNFAGLDSNGNLTDSGSKAADFATAAQGGKADTAIQGVKVDGTDLPLDADNKVNVQLPHATTTVPLMDGNAATGTETAWAKGDHVHPTDISRQAVANMDGSITTAPQEDHYPSTSAVASFVNSSISTNTANFLGSFNLTDLGLTYPATDAQIATALTGHAWPTGTPTNNDYVYVEIQDPQTTGVDDRVERFKYNDTLGWGYEYTLNNSSFTAAEVAALESGITATDKGNYDAHLTNTNNPHGVTKSQVGLGSVVNTGDSATPVSGGTTKFTTGGAYTELAKKVDKETGKGLSANDFTNTYRAKLDGIASGAEVNVQSDWNQSDNTKDDFIKNKPSLATVATSGSYNDLSNKPTIPAAQVNSDWNVTSGVAKILNKPTLATVATSGSYNDLSNKPTIPAAANNGVLTITQNGTSKGTFSANQSSNGTIALTDTTYSAGTGLSLNGTSFSVTNPFNPNGDYSGNTLRAETAKSADYAAAAGSAATATTATSADYAAAADAANAASYAAEAAAAASSSTLETQVSKGLKAYKESIKWVKSIQGKISGGTNILLKIGDSSDVATQQCGVMLSLYQDTTYGKFNISIQFGSAGGWSKWNSWLGAGAVQVTLSSLYARGTDAPSYACYSNEINFNNASASICSVSIGGTPGSGTVNGKLDGIFRFIGENSVWAFLTFNLAFATSSSDGCHVYGMAHWSNFADH